MWSSAGASMAFTLPGFGVRFLTGTGLTSSPTVHHGAGVRLRGLIRFRRRKSRRGKEVKTTPAPPSYQWMFKVLPGGRVWLVKLSRQRRASQSADALLCEHQNIIQRPVRVCGWINSLIVVARSEGFSEDEQRRTHFHATLECFIWVKAPSLEPIRAVPGV